MSAPPLLEASVNRPAVGEALGCLVSIPLILGVIVVVNLMIGADDLPPAVAGSTPWLGLATVITGGFAAVMWVRSRIPLRVVEHDGIRFLEIDDPNGAIVLKGPFELEYGFFQMHMPKAGTQTVLVVGVYQQGELEVSFTETWGSVYTPPEGWRNGIQLTGDAKASYAASAGTFCEALVRLLA